MTKSESGIRSLRIEVPSIPENIRIVESFIDNAKDAFEINDDIYGNIMVAVTESVNNAIIHGNKLDKQKIVVLELEQTENQLDFIVSDQGIGFDYQHLPDPTLEENLEKPGGRGLFLVKHLCDEVKFLNNGSSVKMTFYFD
jgi:serine/threonine-protein kinase RsbW